MNSRATYAIAAVATALSMSTVASAAIINVPGDQPTIQAAIAVAEPGDVVLVAPGT